MKTFKTLQDYSRNDAIKIIENNSKLMEQAFDIYANCENDFLNEIFDNSFSNISISWRFFSCYNNELANCSFDSIEYMSYSSFIDIINWIIEIDKNYCIFGDNFTLDKEKLFRYFEVYDNYYYGFVNMQDQDVRNIENYLTETITGIEKQIENYIMMFTDNCEYSYISEYYYDILDANNELNYILVTAI